MSMFLILVIPIPESKMVYTNYSRVFDNGNPVVVYEEYSILTWLTITSELGH